MVYPRVCGGTPVPPGRWSRSKGLSPRVRGNQVITMTDTGTIRSIPACAGEPRRAVRMSAMSEVYPRVCGGTPTRSSQAARGRGLSPRVRGNPVVQPHHHIVIRSIPACAGEPGGGRQVIIYSGVYPRVCGGTLLTTSRDLAMSGLSPRVRGNLFGVVADSAPEGSIPACAGEPHGVTPTSTMRPVYPRVCGGTASKAGILTAPGGLSPRVRGNLLCRLADVSPRWSIPACAGEPARDTERQPLPSVYPRVCGGTRPCRWHCSRYRGLSPRVRGNRVAHRGRNRVNGSIPACAGEPRPLH